MTDQEKTLFTATRSCAWKSMGNILSQLDIPDHAVLWVRTSSQGARLTRFNKAGDWPKIHSEGLIFWTNAQVTWVTDGVTADLSWIGSTAPNGDGWDTQHQDLLSERWAKQRHRVVLANFATLDFDAFGPVSDKQVLAVVRERTVTPEGRILERFLDVVAVERMVFQD